MLALTEGAEHLQGFIEEGTGFAGRRRRLERGAGLGERLAKAVRLAGGPKELRSAPGELDFSSPAGESSSARSSSAERSRSGRRDSSSHIRTLWLVSSMPSFASPSGPNAQSSEARRLSSSGSYFASHAAVGVVGQAAPASA